MKFPQVFGIMEYLSCLPKFFINVSTIKFDSLFLTVMKNLLFTSMLLLFASTMCQAQMQKPTLYTDLSVVCEMGDEGLNVYNYTPIVGGFSAINVDDFVTNTQTRPLPYYLPIALEVGVQQNSKKGNKLNVGLTYTHLLRSSEDYSRLRFSDQIDPERGFVAPTTYDVISGFQQFHSIGIKMMYLVEDNFSRVAYRAGFGGGLERVLASSCFLNVQHYQTNQSYDFSAKDLIIKDKNYRFTPKLTFQVRAIAAIKYNLWVTSTYSANIRDVSKENPLRSYLQFGLRMDFAKSE